MAMLAGPRRKQKVINLRAKNNEWSNDKNKFGQRLLEKMGWSEGRGLGVKENGIVEHVVARYKNDDKGFGYVDKNDQWTKHEDDFNALLANLSGNNDKDQSQESLHSGKSLEIKSKKSKARIHYHKFTRGKDLARYSEKDLANIFGKKTLKSNENEGPPKEDDSTEKVFTEKGSMYDYFKSKMANIKIGSKVMNKINDEEEELLDHCFQGFSNSCCTPEDSNGIEESRDAKKIEPFSFYPTYTKGDSKDRIDTALNNSEDEVKKNKKKKKSKHSEELSESIENFKVPENPEITEIKEEHEQKIKKSRKRCKDKVVEYNENQEAKKKKKKDKKEVEDIVSSEFTHKTKKKKNKDNE